MITGIEALKRLAQITTKMAQGLADKVNAGEMTLEQAAEQMTDAKMDIFAASGRNVNRDEELKISTVQIGSRTPGFGLKAEW